MALNFSLKIPGKKTVKNVVKKFTNVVERNVEGIIVEQNGKYVVLYNDTFYLIHPESFNTKGKRKVYVRDDVGRWLMYDRVCKEDRRPMPSMYLPFKPKFKCRGNIVIKDNIEVFKIKASWNENNVNEYEEAMKVIEEDADNES